MRVFFLLLGAVFGLYLGVSRDIGSVIAVCIALPFAAYASAKHHLLKWFLLAFLIAIALPNLRFGPTLGNCSVRGVVIKTSENYYILQTPMRRYYVYEASHTREVGDLLDVQGYVKGMLATTYESQFDFKRYLSELGVEHQLYPKSVTEAFRMPLRLRSLQRAYLSHFSSEDAELLDAILFGRKEMANATLTLASGINILFLFSGSGLLLGLFERTLRRLLSIKLSEKAASVISILALISLSPMLCQKLGAMRVILLSLIRLWGLLRQKGRFPRLMEIGIAGIVQLAIDPFSALQTSFLLGYGISVCFAIAAPRWRKYKKWRQKIHATLLTQIIVFPGSLSYSGGVIHFFSFVFVEAMIPLVFIYLLFGYAGFFLSFPMVNVIHGLGVAIRWCLTLLSTLDLKINLGQFGSFLAFLYYAVFLLCAYLHEIGHFELKKKVAFICIAVYCVSLLPVNYLISDQVSFINVGQGDSILIRNQDKVILLDTGGSTYFDMAEKTLIPFFHKERIYHIDYLIASHGDFDHIGAKDSLIANFPVRNFIDSAASFPLTIGQLTFTNYNVYEGGDENDSSLVLYLEFMNKKWLFTGDASIAIEKKIIADHPNLDCDILKAGHHGSDTSTCDAWLDTVTPDTAIISVGGKNTYGHPKASVINALKKRGIKIRRTDEEGTITYRSIFGIGL